MLELAREFASGAATCTGVIRVAVVGSILTAKPRPKDVDVLVTVTASVDLAKLAKLGVAARRSECAGLTLVARTSLLLKLAALALVGSLAAEAWR